MTVHALAADQINALFLRRKNTVGGFCDILVDHTVFIHKIRDHVILDLLRRVKCVQDNAATLALDRHIVVPDTEHVWYNIHRQKQLCRPRFLIDLINVRLHRRHKKPAAILRKTETCGNIKLICGHIKPLRLALRGNQTNLIFASLVRFRFFVCFGFLFVCRPFAVPGFLAVRRFAVPRFLAVYRFFSVPGFFSVLFRSFSVPGFPDVLFRPFSVPGFPGVLFCRPGQPGKAPAEHSHASVGSRLHVIYIIIHRQIIPARHGIRLPRHTFVIGDPSPLRAVFQKDELPVGKLFQIHKFPGIHIQHGLHIPTHGDGVAGQFTRLCRRAACSVVPAFAAAPCKGQSHHPRQPQSRRPSPAILLFPVSLPHLNYPPLLY